MAITLTHPFRTLTLVSVATLAAVAVPTAMMANDGPSPVPAQPATIAADPCADVGQGLPESIESRTQACRAGVAAAGAERASLGFDPCGNVGQGLPESIELRTRACREDVAAAAAFSGVAALKDPAGDADPCADVGQGLQDSIDFRKQACRADVAAGKIGG